MYLEYPEYRKMGGTLDETTFNNFEFEAECTINWYTFNRLIGETTVSEKVKKLTYRLIQLAQLNQEAMTLGKPITGEASKGAVGAVTSQSNDGFSTVYNSLSAADALSASALSSEKVKTLIRSYLQGEVNSLGRKLLYRGLYPNE